MNAIDGPLVLWLNHLAGRSGTFDGLVKDLSDNSLIQAVVPVTILCYFWFRRAMPQVVRRNRELIIVTQLGAIAAIAIARGLALILPFRTRPLATPGLGYHVINPGWSTDLHQWSSFPSDHAVLFFALATGIALLSRWTGVAMLLYAAIVDCLPRVYLGLHYPSDLVAGAFLGSAAVLIAAKPQVRRPVAERVLRCFERSPGLAYAAAFLCSFGLATMFDSAENLARDGIRVMFATARHTPLVRAPLHLNLGQSAIGATVAAIVSGLILAGASIVVMRRASRGQSHADSSSEREERPQMPDAGAFSGDVSPSDEFSGDALPISIMDGAEERDHEDWLSPDLLEFTHDAIIIWEMDGAGILYWNSAAEQLYGYSRHEVRGQVTHDLLSTRLAGGGGGGTELEGRLARYGVWVGELHHRTRNGRIVQVDARLALMSQQNGRWLVLEVNRDITDQRKAEALREQAVARLIALRESAP